MVTVFSTSASNVFASVPSSEKLILRSTAADTMNATLSGIVSAAQSSETLALTGTKEVQSADTYDSLSLVRLASAPSGIVSVFRQGTAGTGDIRIDTLPVDAETVTFGLAGFTQAYRWKDTTSAAFDVKIGATVADCAANLKAAVNADGVGDGTDYHTGTTAHPDLSATVATALVTVTDRLACSRQLAWSFAQSSTKNTIRTVTGGANGSTVASLYSSGYESIASALYLDDETLSDSLLPAGLTPTSDAIQIGGRPFSIDVDCENVSSPIELKYQHSRDNTNWIDGATAIADADNNSQRIVPTEICEYARIVITANANTTAVSVNIKIVSG